MRRTGFILAGLAVLFSACTDEVLSPDGGVQGEVMISLSSTGETNAVPGLKSSTSADEAEELPDLDGFEVEIYNSNGIRLYRDTYANTVGRRIALNAGEYRLLAQHGDSTGIGFDARWFAADEPFTVHGQTVEEISAVARMAKVKVAVNYGPQLKEQYSQYHSRVRLDGSASRHLKFEKDETRAAYFPAGELGYEFYAIVEGEWKYFPAAPVACQPNDFITFNVEIDSGTGSLKVVTVQIDDEMNVIEQEQMIPAEAGPKDPPVITMNGFTVSGEETQVYNYTFIEATEPEWAQADIVAKAGIAKCILGIRSDYLAAIGVPDEIDLTSGTPDAAVMKAMRSVGIRWPREIEGARFANIDFSAMPDALMFEPGNEFSAEFTLTVTDALERTCSQTFSVANKAPGNLSFSPAEGNAFARSFKGLTASVDEGNPGAIVFQYRTAGSEDWISVSPSGSEGTRAVFSDVKGLVPETEYQVRTIYNYNENYASEPVTLKTEAAAQVGNAGFEDNYSVEKYRQSVLWAKNTIYGFYFWNKSSEEGDRWWDTLNDLTTPNPGDRSVWDYRSAAGTVPTSDEGGNTASSHLRTYDGQSLTTEGHNGTAAEIATVGWGSGNTWATSGSSSVASRTAGELYIGTYSNGSADYGKPFRSRPSAVTFWYKYYSYNNESTTPYAEVYAKDGHRIGYGSMSIASSVDSFIQGRIDIEYSEFVPCGKFTIVFKSTDSDSPSTKAVQGGSGAMSGYLDSRHIGSILTVDDVELIYE